MINSMPPPGTRDYIGCPLCGRPINMQRMQQGSQHAQSHGNTLQPIPPCDVCQQRMQVPSQEQPSSK